MKQWLTDRLRDAWAWSLVALWLGLTVVYMLSAPSGITFEDTSLFAGACATLGLPHPPGYPLYVWSCFPVSWLAGLLGLSQEFGATLWSAFTTAAACVVLAMLIRRVAGVPAVALFAAGLFGLAPSVWDQAQIPEVYGLNLLLLMTCWYLCQRFVEDGERHWLYALACCTGLGLAAHWPLFVLNYPFLLLWLAQAWPRLLEFLRDKRVIACCLALFVAGLLPYMHLLLVSSESHMFDRNYNTGKIFAYVSRELYGLGGDYLPWSQRIGGAAKTSVWFMREYLYLCGLAVPVGLFVLWRKREHWQIASVACGMLMTTSFLCLARPFDPYSNLGAWVFHAYPLGAYAVAALPLALGLGYVLSMTRWGQGNIAIVFAVLAGVAFGQFPDSDRRAENIAADYSRLILQLAPQDALVVNHSDDYGFALYYTNRFYVERPDLEITSEKIYLESLDDGFVSADEEKKLLAEQRPVVFLSKLKLKELGLRYHGTHFTLAKDVAPGTVDVDIDDEAREFIAQSYELNKQGVRNAFTTQFLQSMVTNYVAILEAARLQGKQLSVEDFSLLSLAIDTPEGKFASFLAFILDSPQTPSPEEIEKRATEMNPYLGDLPRHRRSDFLHLIATARLFGGDMDGAQEALRVALEQHPSDKNQRVLIDLLQILATQGDYEGYEQLRKKYPQLKSGTALAAYDARCKEFLLRACVAL